MRNQTLASILNSRKPRTISDVTAIAYRSRHEDDFDHRPTLVLDRNAYTASERAWFRRPLGAIALVIALAIGGTASAAPRAESPAVAAAKQEVQTARAHLKSARATERAAHKAASKAKRIARLRASLAKLEAPTTESK